METYHRLNVNVQEVIDNKIAQILKENNKDILHDLYEYFYNYQYKYDHFRCADKLTEYDMDGECEDIIVFY